MLGIADAITKPQRCHIRPDCDDYSGSLLAVNKRQRRRITTFAKIDINEVNARRADLNQSFVWFWVGDGHVDESRALPDRQRGQLGWLSWGEEYSKMGQ